MRFGRPSRRAAWLVPVALTTLTVCGGKPEPVRWNELDFEAMVADMANPTGTVTNENVLEIAEAFTDNAEAIILLGKILDRMFPTGVEDALVDSGGAPLAPGGDELVDLVWETPASAAEDGDEFSLDLEGTSVFVKLACWGPEPLDPDLSFRHGYIRVDGPGLSEEVIENLEYTGDFLLSFRRCRFPTGTLAGRNVGFYDTIDGAPVFALRLLTYVYAGGKVSQFINERVLIRDGVFSVLYFLADGSGTLRVDSSVDYETFSVSGENGAFACSTLTGELECAVLP